MTREVSNKFKKLTAMLALSILISDATTHSALAAKNTNPDFEGMMENWDWNNMMGSGWEGGLFLIMGGIMMILFWLVFILAAIALLRWLINNLEGKPAVSSRAMDTLKEKYAKGEITKEEFEVKKKDIV